MLDLLRQAADRDGVPYLGIRDEACSRGDKSPLHMVAQMHCLATGPAPLLDLAIIAIGAGCMATPRTATRGFGLPLPEEGADIARWLSLNGVR